jgi:sugar phosphate isomerase/epimerase
MLQHPAPAIWTALYAELPLDEALRTLAGHGWTQFEVSTEHFCELEAAADGPARVERVLQTCRTFGLGLPQGHALLQANVAHPDPAQRALDQRRLASHLHLAHDLGVRTVVVHPGMAPQATTRAERHGETELNVEAFRRLGELAGELGCRLAIENMTRHGYCSAVDLAELLGAIDSPAVGVAFDSSHAHLIRGLDLAAAASDFGSRLWATHLSDNDGSGDQHRTPGNGTIDWAPLMRALAAADYDGLINLEIPGERHAALELRALKSRHALAVAGWLVALAGSGPAPG